MPLCYSFPVQTGPLFSAQTSMEMAGSSCPPPIIAWGTTGKRHREQSWNRGSGVSEGVLFQSTILVRMLGVQGSSPATTGRQGIFLFGYTGAGEICASCLMRKAGLDQRNKR